MIRILFEKRIVDDSGFLRTPDRPVELLGTRERYPRSGKTTIGARGPDFLGGSATATKLKADFEDMKLKLQLDCSTADIRTKQVRQQNERYIISQQKLLDEGSTIEQNDIAMRMEVALGCLLKQALHDHRAAFAKKMM